MGVLAPLNASGLSHWAYHEVLAALAELGPSSQQQLAERLGINRTIMVSLIDAMEQGALVERNRDPADRRSYALIS